MNAYNLQLQICLQSVGHQYAPSHPTKRKIEPRTRLTSHGYLLTEALVYIGLIFVLLGVAYVGLYRFIDNSVVLRRSAEDISRAMHAGELWRADVRSAGRGIGLEATEAGSILHLANSRGEIAYTYRDGAVYRRVDKGTWVRVLKDVKASSMEADVQPHITGWRWELELQPQTKGIIKGGRVRPLFTFLSAQKAG